MELSEYIAPLRKWWWLVATATLVAAITSFISVSRQPLIYQARTTLMVGRAIENPNPSSGDFAVSQQLATTYVNVAQTDRVRRGVRTALGLDALPAYAVRLLPNTQLIEIAVVDTNPARAQAVANEIANQLVLQSPTASEGDQQERKAFIDQQLAGLEADIQTTEEEIAVQQEEMQGLISARDLENARIQIDALQDKLNTLQSIYSVLLSNTEEGATNIITILAPASLPEQPIGPQLMISVLTAAAVGLVLSGGAAYLLEYLDDTIKSSKDVERISGLPTLVGINRVKSDAEDHVLVSLARPRSPATEAFRVLRTSIQFSNTNKPRRTFLITSPNANEGKSLTVANLAVVLAQAINDVMLIDADLHRPVQHTIFGLSREYGLSTLLLSLLLQTDPDSIDELRDDLILADELVQSTSESGLSVLTSGPTPRNPPELLGSYTMKMVLSSLVKKYDYVILDGPPVLPVTDAVVLSTQVDGVMLLIDAGQTRRKELKEAVKRLQEVDANLIGVILNRVPASEQYSNRNSYYYNEAGDRREREFVAVNGSSRVNGILNKWWRKEHS